jgi:hypothetical protein
MVAPSPRQLRDLALDLAVEERKLDALVDSLGALGEVVGDRLRIDAAALRLQSFYTGIERCFLQISRVLNGGTPDGGDLASATPRAHGPAHGGEARLAL